MTLGDSPCTLLVSPWLGEVVGASLAMGPALVQPLLAPGAIMTVIRCSVGAPSECRDASASLTFGTDFSGTRTRIHVLFAVLHQARRAWCRVSNRLLIRVRVLEISVPKVVTTEKRYVRRTDY